MSNHFLLGISVIMVLIFSSCEKPEPTNHTVENTFSLFTEIPASESGLDFSNQVIEDEQNNYFTNQYIYNGGGVGLGDVNNDGLCDVFLGGNSSPDKLYINKGDLNFEDVSGDAGILDDGNWTTGISMIDLNADGWLDIYVCRAGNFEDSLRCKNLLYMNKRDGTFSEISSSCGLGDMGFSTQASFFDFDKDGDLDVYVMNFPGEFDGKDLKQVLQGGKSPYRDADRLYRNESNGLFTDVSESAGIDNYAFGLGISTADFNGDSWVDIYVANDYQENDYLYINQKDGTFKESVRRYCNHNAQSAMGMDRGDINNDGLIDFFVAEMLPSDYKRSKVNMASMNIESFRYFISQGMHHQYMHNVLQLNNGGFYSDISQMLGVDKTDWSWSPLFEDFDNDTDQDLIVTNGIVRDMMFKDASSKRKKMQKEGKKVPLEELYADIPSTPLLNYFYRNEGGLKMSDASENCGLTSKSFSNGSAAADLDNDGDLDLVINNIDSDAFIYRNNTNNNAYLTVQLNHPNTPNPQGINSTIRIWKEGKVQIREVITARGFQSSSPAMAHFGLSDSLTVDSLEVSWDSGQKQKLYDLAAGQKLEIVFENAPQLPNESSNERIFAVAPSEFQVDFKHRETDFDDYVNEILLPHRQSQLGPFVSKGDIDGNGWEDFFIGGAAGQAGVLYLNDGTEFKLSQQPDLQKDAAYEDMESCFVDVNNDGFLDLYVISGSNEFFNQTEMYQDRLYINQGNGTLKKDLSLLPEIVSNGSVVVAGDLDGDGDDDLFVGGRATPSKYPFPDTSFILWNNDGQLTLDTNALNSAGIVTCAEILDFNKDGKNDLIIAGEWMNLQIYLNSDEGLVLSDIIPLELNGVGWYYSMVTGDFNEDGAIDIALGNVGLNHKFKASNNLPFHIYTDDFDNSGSPDIVLAYEFEEGEFPVRGKQCMSEQMPFISEEKFETYDEFGRADMGDIFGNRLQTAGIHLEATNFASGVWLSENDSYSWSEWPREAQVSSVNAILIDDFNSDGTSDFLLAGNMFETEVETSRLDASIGLFMDAKTTPSLNSGFFAPFDVKDLISIEVKDGTIVIVSSNNRKIQSFISSK